MRGNTAAMYQHKGSKTRRGEKSCPVQKLGSVVRQIKYICAESIRFLTIKRESSWTNRNNMDKKKKKKKINEMILIQSSISAFLWASEAGISITELQLLNHNKNKAWSLNHKIQVQFISARLLLFLSVSVGGGGEVGRSLAGQRLFFLPQTTCLMKQQSISDAPSTTWVSHTVQTYIKHTPQNAG